MSRQRWIAVIGVCFSLVFAFAWFSRPHSLRSKIEEAGVHLTRVNTSGGSGTYDVKRADRAKIATILCHEGFKKLGNIGIDVVGDRYLLERRFLTIWGRKQYVNLDAIQGLFVEFDPDI